jgi:uncharacterized membrane-anchored protein
MRKTILIGSSLCVFALLNYAIYEKEQVKANGETVYLELAPVDPRSLMQGDYMALRYAIEGNIKTVAPQNKRGFMVIALDENRVARFVRFDDGEALQLGEKLLRYHNDHGSIAIVPNSFLFQEGHAQSYQRARYGEFKFDSGGKHILTGLASENRERIVGRSE